MNRGSRILRIIGGIITPFWVDVMTLLGVWELKKGPVIIPLLWNLLISFEGVWGGLECKIYGGRPFCRSTAILIKMKPTSLVGCAYTSKRCMRYVERRRRRNSFASWKLFLLKLVKQLSLIDHESPKVYVWTVTNFLLFITHCISSIQTKLVITHGGRNSGIFLR